MADSLISSFILVFLPILAGLTIISPYFPAGVVQIRRFAKGFNCLYLCYAALFMLLLNPKSAGFGFINKLPFDIIPNLNLTISFALDGFSALMCLVVSIIILFALMMSKTMINTKQKFFYSLLLVLEGATIGLLSANNFFTFFLFTELELIPLYFLISIWGGNAARKSAVKYVLFAGTGALLMLISIGLVCAVSADFKLLADFDKLILAQNDFPLLTELVVAVGFLIAFAVKLPIFPLHGAMTDVKSEAPVPVSMVLSSIIPLGALYGIIRFNVQIFYTLSQLMAPALMFLCAIGALWVAFAAFKQSEIKKLLAYASNGAFAVVILGAVSFTEFGLEGAIYQTIMLSLTFSALYLGTGVIISKFKTSKIALLTGIANYMPAFCAFMFILALNLLQTPFTAGFFGALMNILGAANSPLSEKSYFLANLIQISAFLGLVASIIIGICVLKFVGKTFFGISDLKTFGAKILKEEKPDEPKTFEEAEPDLENAVCELDMEQKQAPVRPVIREEEKKTFTLANHQTTVLFITCAALIIFGFYPQGIVDKISTFASINISAILANIF